MSLDILTLLETAILARLAPLKDTFRTVGATRDDVAAGNGPVSRAELTVEFRGSRFGPLRQEHPLVIDETLQFEVSFALADRRTHATSYPPLRRVIALLAGFCPDDGEGKCLSLGPISPVSSGYLGQEEQSKAYVYGALFSVPTEFINPD